MIASILCPGNIELPAAGADAHRLIEEDHNRRHTVLRRIDVRRLGQQTGVDAGLQDGLVLTDCQCRWHILKKRRLDECPKTRRSILGQNINPGANHQVLHELI